VVLNEHTMVSGYRLLCELCLSGMLWDTVNGLSMSIKWWLRLYFCLLQEYNIKAILNIACKRERQWFSDYGPKVKYSDNLNFK